MARPKAIIPDAPGILTSLRTFKEFGAGEQTKHSVLTPTGTLSIPVVVNEFWTSKQRAAHSLHEVSYRACFKPQLPRFFIERLTSPGEIVYDPFMGRGTTLLEAALLGRRAFGCDINPVSLALVEPRLNPPTLREVATRLLQIPWDYKDEIRDDLRVFYHETTLRKLMALRKYFVGKKENGPLDKTDSWIQMVSLNRLTGHSPGFFSVYTLPPNQAVSVVSQIKINEKRNQVPPVRDVEQIILKKTKQLLKDLSSGEIANLKKASGGHFLLNQNCAQTGQIPPDSVSLVVTSPPFLDVVDYATDNWLRCWFLGIDAKEIEITILKKLEKWQEAMSKVFRELSRILKPGGHVAFEVGEVRNGKIKLEETIVPCGQQAGLDCVAIMINAQEFTKTANCWGVDNNTKGTNTNRILIFRKPDEGRIV